MTDDIRTKSIMKNLRLIKVYEDEYIPDDMIIYQRVWQYDRIKEEPKAARWYQCKIGTLKTPSGELVRTIKYTNNIEFPPLKTIQLDLHPFVRSRLFFPMKRDSNTAFYIEKNFPEFRNEI